MTSSIASTSRATSTMRLATARLCGEACRVRIPQSRYTFARPLQRGFATTHACTLQARGIIYDTNGDPRELVRGHAWDMPKPQDGQVLIRTGLSSINPADINVVQGVYPSKPLKRKLPGLDSPAFIGGNEGFGIVEEVQGDGGQAQLKQGDWVVFGQPQMGTWRNYLVCNADHLVKIDQSNNGGSKHTLTDVMTSTLQVNPATAYRMLHDFVKLDPKRDVIIQNTANSAVGQAVAQIASRALGIESINLVRGGGEDGKRPDMDDLVKSFAGISKTGIAKAHLFTYEELAAKGSSAKDRIKEIIKGKDNSKGRLRLGLNALCGVDNMNMAKLLTQDATLVTYGAMSKKPLMLPASSLIFKNLSARGFMMNKWYAQNGLEARQELMRQLVQYYQDGTLTPPPATIVEIGANDSPEDMTQKARDAISKSMGGYGGRKFFFKFVE